MWQDFFVLTYLVILLYYKCSILDTSHCSLVYEIDYREIVYLKNGKRRDDVERSESLMHWSDSLFLSILLIIGTNFTENWYLIVFLKFFSKNSIKAVLHCTAFILIF